MDIEKLYRQKLADEIEQCDDPVGAIVDQALKELEISRKKADAVLQTARQQASRLYREAQREARKLLSKARAKSLRLEDIARSRAGVLEREAREKGTLDGMAAARAEIRRECEEGLTALSSLCKSAADEKALFFERSRADLVELMMLMLRKVVGVLDRRIDTLVRDNLAAIVESSFSAEDGLYIRLNPGDLEAIERTLENCSSDLSVAAVFRSGRIHFRPDSSLVRGSCRIHSDSSGVAFSFEKRLASLEKSLVEMLENPSDV